MLSVAQKCQCGDFPTFAIAKKGFSVDCDTCGRSSGLRHSLETAVLAWNEMGRAESAPAAVQLAKIDSILRAYGWNGTGALVDAVKALTTDAGEMMLALREEIEVLNKAFDLIERFVPDPERTLFGSLVRERMQHFVLEDKDATVNADATARA